MAPFVYHENTYASEGTVMPVIKNALIVCVLLSGALYSRESPADIPYPASITEAFQEGQDVIIHLEDSDYAWHTITSLTYSIVRRKESDSCRYSFILKDDLMIAGEVIINESWCDDLGDSEYCEGDAGVDAGCNDCDEDGVLECYGECYCCSTTVEYVDKCVSPGRYEYLLLTPSEDIEKDRYSLDEEEDPITLDGIGKQLVLGVMDLEVVDSDEECKPEKQDTANVCGLCSLCPVSDNYYSIQLLIVMLLAGLFALRRQNP